MSAESIGKSHATFSPTPRELACTLFRHPRLISISFGLVLVAAMLFVFFSAFFFPAGYESHFKLLQRKGLVDPVVSLQLGSAVDFTRPDITEEELNSEVGPLREAELLKEVVNIAALFVADTSGIKRPAALGTIACGLFGLVLLCLLQQAAWKRRRRTTKSRKILIIGGGPVARSIARALRHDPLHRATVCGFLDDEQPLSPAVLGQSADLDWLARAEFMDEVIVALPDQPGKVQEAAQAAFGNHLDILAVPDLPTGTLTGSGMDRIGEVPAVTLHREPSPSVALFLKRLLDLSGAALALILSSPLMAMVALLIRLDSPGPIIYSVERAGAKGRRFRYYKFRTMVSNAAHLKEDLRARNGKAGPTFEIDDDPRITRVGHILRRYCLDALPQLWNVLRGEMSLVGPRPRPIDEVDHHELQQFRRLDVKPGITGLWQITARGCPSFELNLHLDLTYIENWSLRLDLRILAGSVRVLFAPEGT
jgi:exopolysaccharide biosynthesis polyprenyl glycosylphosphotransferase